MECKLCKVKDILIKKQEEIIKANKDFMDSLSLIFAAEKEKCVNGCDGIQQVCSACPPKH